MLIHSNNRVVQRTNESRRLNITSQDNALSRHWTVIGGLVDGHWRVSGWLVDGHWTVSGQSLV